MQFQFTFPIVGLSSTLYDIRISLGITYSQQLLQYNMKMSIPGHGIKAHRVIKALCELIGIRDIECSLEGAHNPLHMAKAFFLGLLRQRTHQVI